MKKAVLAKISQFFASQEGVVAVYLYGSQAKKIATAKSDLDLAVLFDRRPKNLDQILTLGASLQDLGKIEEAIAVIREIVDEKPSNLDAWRELGICYSHYCPELHDLSLVQKRTRPESARGDHGDVQAA